MRKLTHGSTFSGIGAPEVAAEMLGIENLFHCEINPFGRKVLDYWFPKAESYEDITKTDFAKWRGKIDILTGGFPCQPFSYAGKRRGAEDDRYLWPFMLKCIQQVRPTWFVGENVAGITTMVLPGKTVEMGGQTDIFGESDHITRTEQAYVLDEICRNLENIGYSVQPVIIPACAVGAPHRRDRIFIIAHDERNNPADTESFGHRGSRSEECGNSRRPFQSKKCPRSEMGCETKGCGRELHASNTNSNRRIQGDYEVQPQQPNGTESQCNGRLGNASNARDTDRRCSQNSERKWDDFRAEERWRKFPSVSPICRGNDGLPFNVDDLTISYAKWRTETLKAYGNAIVVQVIYSIFKYIQIVENG